MQEEQKTLNNSKVMEEFANIDRIQKETYAKIHGKKEVSGEAKLLKDTIYKRQENVPYEEEEVPEVTFFVKEVLKVKDFGTLYLSNYKLSFQPSAVKDPSKLSYFVVPYGYIHRVVE